MKITKESIKYGTVVYEESVWTGKKSLYVNNEALSRDGKSAFVYTSGTEVVRAEIKGNMITGSKLFIGEEEHELTPKPKWYEIACSVFIFLLIMVWGNSVALCSIVPVVGGAIGGAISALMAFANLMMMKSTDKLWKKLVYFAAMTVATFLICFIIAMAILSLIS